MNILKRLNDAILYLSEGAAMLFSPSQDDYPNIGLQPYDGDPYSEWVYLSNRDLLNSP
ncbi:MAG: hypothetical protein KME07_10335 [Pegethrix bostrychoides GSE-TBD4-15B]|jgi:hypothetical protein|uniref:Uncharacterized protein n=1 Tax=Pegethrix bostrychoides GSE-TBD4-15B TaxID=2839662 RepID=A0A951PB12_9CYAN|nr:hypothetical protein [Pegethrix bostrychoides GSE-TBD4-15B]